MVVVGRRGVESWTVEAWRGGRALRMRWEEGKEGKRLGAAATAACRRCCKCSLLVRGGSSGKGCVRYGTCERPAQHELRVRQTH